MSVTIIPGLNDKILHGSVYENISAELELAIAGSHRKIPACRLDTLDQEYLDCLSDDPILEVEHVVF